MDTANQATNQLLFRFQRFITGVWTTLRSPTMTGVLLLVLAAVIVLRLLLPSPLTPDIPAAWIASLPLLVQPWGEFLFSLGLSQILQSVWFWIPLALLLLNSLLALADYTLPSWRRVRATNDAASIGWQHPLAYRTERSVRLPESPDGYLGKLKESLKADGFSIEAPLEDNQRMVSATRWRWVWLGVVTFYGGLVLLCVAFVASHYSLKTENLTLFPRELETSQLFDGSLELLEIDAASRSGVVVFRPEEAGQLPRTLRWRLYLPTLSFNLLVLPTAIEPVLTIEARDETGELRRLMPVQEDLSPATRLNLPFGRPGAPFYFLIPSASLAFQILPVSMPNQDGYNVQVRRGSESSPSENLMVGMGEAFEIDDISVTITLNHSLKFMARQDLTLPLFIVSIIVIVASALLLFFRRPWQVWLLPEVKGRGGQLYGVVEKFGSTKGTSEFLEELLVEEKDA